MNGDCYNRIIVLVCIIKVTRVGCTDSIVYSWNFLRLSFHCENSVHKLDDIFKQSNAKLVIKKIFD